MKTKAHTAAQIDTLAQRLSETPVAASTSAKKAGDNFARLLAARIGAERAAPAFTSIMTADTADQAEARLILVLDYGNPDPAGEPIPVPVDQPKLTIAPAIGKRQAVVDLSERHLAARPGFLQTDPRPVPRQAGADRGFGRGGRHRRFAGLRDQPGLFQPESHGALPRSLPDCDQGTIGGGGMKITREFAPADRYLYDFGLCSYANGWAQVDMAQDASYFGTWANPTLLMIFNYCEGDTTLKEAASPEEFAAELREIDAWNRAHGYGPVRIDPGFDPAMKAAFEGLGLAEMLH